MDPKFSRALSDLGRGVRRRAHNERKRTVGVTVTPRKTAPKPPSDPYHRDAKQIADYQERAKSQFPDN